MNAEEAVARALKHEPQTMRQLVGATGYTRNTVRLALERNQARQVPNSWPPEYTLELPEEVVIIPPSVEPLEIPVDEVGPRWQQGVTKLAKEIVAIDLETLDLADAIKALEVEAASLLGVLEALRSVKDGPDWRQQIGFPP